MSDRTKYKKSKLTIIFNEAFLHMRWESNKRQSYRYLFSARRMRHNLKHKSINLFSSQILNCILDSLLVLHPKLNLLEKFTKYECSVKC